MMQRKLLYTSEYVRGFRIALREARDDLAELDARHQSELQELYAEVRELREVLTMIVGTLHTQAEADLHALRRKLELALARLERDPAKPLH